MKSKPVQIAIIVIGLLVGVVGIVLAISKNSGPDIANKMFLVDVKTGELYAVSTTKRSIILPYRHPETNEPSLLPVNFDEDRSAWFVKSRYLGAAGDLQPVSDKIDMQSGRVSAADGIKPKVIQ